MAYEWGEHVGELELQVTAADEAGLFEEALRALGELMGDEQEGGRAERFEVAAAGDDRAALFATWLEELAFLAETEGLVPVDVDELVLGPREVRAAVRGYRGEPPHLVKAVTYHRLAYERSDGGWRALAILDV
jgi:SHS2 domain-containing protein